MVEKLNPQLSAVGEMAVPDVQIITSGGLRITAHSHILASASPVLESMIERPKKRRSSQRNIPIPGVPCDAVSVFIQFLYSSKCSEEQMEKYGIHLLALSHVYLVPQLKQRCTRELSRRLNTENVLDVLQLARLCDAPDLYLKCMKMLSCNFKAVEHTEGWKFLQNHDPRLELEILQFIDEAEMRIKRTRRNREEQKMYLQLSEAMDCLEHICTEGCTSVGPCDMDPSKNKGPCSKFSTCHGLQLLIKHFAACKKRVNGGCLRCKRMWQLFQLHSSICDKPEQCRVPLCRQFKLKVQQNKRGDDARWRLLVRKVASAKLISSLSLPKRKREDKPWIAQMKTYLEYMDTSPK
ncbi:BTB/POZ and TAZ domain-containing protein 1-like [Olea europaea var. sylvestris]|uniref:BTB POZ and TAZ domain-containing 1 n=3 Tax=Olea europaea subsp. europaea TaxID=158383 RepID=A0A8S0QRV9_OLEEU|nr:BTB/POZ and TAZ domain-containing protein 1-like [Olea europaea var. sylvestris]CAA2967294.1 BTB POZ and TAZ domain-containing 1 [Olea europaea subsp. europaea]